MPPQRVLRLRDASPGCACKPSCNRKALYFKAYSSQPPTAPGLCSDQMTSVGSHSADG